MPSSISPDHLRINPPSATDALLAAAFDDAPAPACLLSPDEAVSILAINRAYLALLGCARDEVLGRPLSELLRRYDTGDEDVALDVAAVVQAHVQADMAGVPATLAGQRWRIVHTAVRDAEGVLQAVSHSLTPAPASDDTGRALAEAKYRTLFDSIDEGFCIIEMLFDAEGRPSDYRFCEINRSFELHTGLRNAVGKTIREMNPAHEQHWFDIYGTVWKTGESVRFEDSSASLDRHFDVYAFRIDEQPVPRVAVLFKDVSAQKRAYRQARESEQRAVAAAQRAEDGRRHLEALLHAAPVGIVMSDREGGVLLANAEHDRLWGGRPPRPRSIAEFASWQGRWTDQSGLHDGPLQAGDWPTARALRGEFVRGESVEITAFGPDPVQRTILMSGAPVTDDSGNVIGAVLVQMDITDRVKAEDALREADRRKDDFLAMLAHELRNPLAPISAAATLLSMAELPPARVRQTSAIIARQARHMSGLVDDLLDVSRVTRGLITMKLERLDLKQIVAEAMEQVRPLLEARGHRTVMELVPRATFVQGDHNRLVQVLTNLLTNAAKYTPEQGLITVAVSVEGKDVRIDVSDNGVGMTPDLIAHIFELFTQASRSPDRSQGGLGIGLALVKSLVELQGGQVSAHSDGAGRGSRFTVTLPLVAAPVAEAPALAAPQQPARSLSVLIVDDNQDAAQVLAMYLEVLGHQVMVEHGAREGYARAIAERPQVCLLDIGLPETDGNALARQLRAHPATRSATLAAISGYGQEHDQQAARDAGFDRYFVKPVNAAQLAQFLDGVASGAGAGAGAGAA